VLCVHALNEAAKLSHVTDLVARKLAGPEHSTLSDDNVEFHRREYDRLRTEFEEAHRNSRLPEVPSARPALHDLLVRLRPEV